MKRIAIFAGVLALLSAMPVLAQTGSDWGSGGFKTYGTTEGGQSGQSGQAGQSGQSSQMTTDRSFTEVDQDGDGMISQSELRQTYGEEVTQHMATMDLDGDGALTQQEYGMMSGGDGGMSGGGMSGGGMSGGSGGSGSGK